jgi:hypothetical protein
MLAQPYVTLLAQPYVNDLADPVGGGGEQPYFYFNGVDQYADANPGSEYRAGGFPFTMQWTTTAASFDTFNVVMDSAAFPQAGYFFAGNFMQYPGVVTPEITMQLVGPVAPDTKVSVTTTFTSAKSTIAGSFGTPSQAEYEAIVLEPLGANGFERIGWDVASTPDYLFDGPIGPISITETSPIQGRDYMVGDGTTFGTLNSDIPIDSSLPFKLEFDWVHSIQGAAQQLLSNRTGSPVMSFSVLTNNTARLIIGATGIYANFGNAFTDVADGQHVHAEILSDGINPPTLQIDQSTPIDSAITGDFFNQTGTVGKFMEGAGGTLSTYGALANIGIEQNGDTWFYELRRDQSPAGVFDTGLIIADGILKADEVIPA